MDPIKFEMELEALREAHPDVVSEFERLRNWCSVCLGEDVARIGGIEV